MKKLILFLATLAAFAQTKDTSPRNLANSGTLPSTVQAAVAAARTAAEATVSAGVQ